MNCPKCGTNDPNCFFDDHDTCADCETEERESMRRDLREIADIASAARGPSGRDFSMVALGAIFDISGRHKE